MSPGVSPLDISLRGLPKSLHRRYMNTAVRITPATFAGAFRLFQHQVETDEDSPGPFRDFQSGLACSMEHYKEWLYLEARRRLRVDHSALGDRITWRRYKRP